MSSTHDSDVPEPESMAVDPTNLGSVDPLSVEGIFLVALGKAGSEREAFLASQCQDPAQKQRVEALLVAYEQAGNFLEKPAVTAEPTPVGQYLTPCELPGTLGRLGQYEILEEIGRGGMGVVFRAHDPKLQRIVAVKALAPELARLPVARQRFLREARAAAAISHPHVVTIFAVDGTEEASLGTERTTLPYLVMECIVGQTLHDKIKRVGALKVEEIVRISRQIAEGLAAAHKRGLIHRDIKPANILLENGVERVKITDFGLARTTSDGGITHTGEILGTPQCMSPEQARGEMVDQRSDLFSLGCVMYTMCTGVSPFRADNILAVMKKVCETEPRPIAQLNPILPEWLCQLVHRLLEKQPERRVQTANEVVDVLESRAVTPQPASAERTNAPSGGSLVEVPLWLETPAMKWISGLPALYPNTCVASFVFGMMHGASRNTVLIESLTLGLVAWLVAALIRQISGRGRWITWPVFAISMLSLSAGSLLGIVLRREAGAAIQGLVFVFGGAIAIFWLLTRWFPRMFIQPRSPQPVSSPSPVPQPFTEQTFDRPAAPPRSPWSFLGWMLVTLFGVGLLGGLLAVAVYQAKMAPTKIALSDIEARFQAALAMENDTARHNTLVRLAEDAAKAGNGELVLKVIGAVKAGTARNNTCAICSEALLNQGLISAATAVAQQMDNDTSRNNMLARIANASLSAVPSRTPAHLNVPIILDGGSMPTPTGVEAPVPRPSLDGSSASPSPSIPLADAIEVLTDPKAMPKFWSSLSGYSDPEAKVLVWIDEPGLQISLKPIDFEGRENAGDVYVSRNAWGVGGFFDSKEGTLVDVLPGRYRVLIQDLDYGWEVDRRGTLVIGNGQHMIHVKRSFAGLQLTPTEYPVPFRWAGKSYQFTTVAEASEINRHLAQLAGETSTPLPGTAGGAIWANTMISEQFEIGPPPGSGWTLRYHPNRVKIDIQSPKMRAVFEHPHGSLVWDHSVPEGFSVPEKDSTLTILRDGFSWWSKDIKAPFDPNAYSAEPLVIRQSRLLDKEAAVRNFEEWRPGMIAFSWYGLDQMQEIPTKSAPAIRRLVTGWADGQPDVPEAELLQLGGATSMEELWKLPHPSGTVVLYDPTAGEKDEPKPKFVPPAFLVPGSTPGTWRMKEPPEGAVVDAVGAVNGVPTVPMTSSVEQAPSEADPQAALLANLQGTWDVDLSGIDDFNDLPPGTRAEFTIEGNLLKLWEIVPPQPGLNAETVRSEAGAMLLTPGAAGPPQQIDLVIGPNDGDKRRETQGIIEITGDTVKLCYDPQIVKGDVLRPVAFAVGKQATLWTLTRPKTEAPRP